MVSLKKNSLNLSQLSSLFIEHEQTHLARYNADPRMHRTVKAHTHSAVTMPIKRRWLIVIPMPAFLMRPTVPDTTADSTFDVLKT